MGAIWSAQIRIRLISNAEAKKYIKLEYSMMSGALSYALGGCVADHSRGMSNQSNTYGRHYAARC